MTAHGFTDRPFDDVEAERLARLLDDIDPAGPPQWTNGYAQPDAEPTPTTPERLRGLEGRYPEPEDYATAKLSSLGDVEYVTDLIRPGRIHIVAAEEGTGKSYAMQELAVRLAVAGGSFAGTWAIEVAGAVVNLYEMHADDDFTYQADVLDALDVDRDALAGRIYRMDISRAANGDAPLVSADWREWFSAWARLHDVRLAIFDTGTNAIDRDPWGPDFRQTMRSLRQMLNASPGLAVVLTMHLKKPQGTGARRMSDILGEWTKWCDVVLLMEDEGANRTKLTTRKRVRHHKRVICTRRDGLLVEPQDITDAKPAKKVPESQQLSDIEAKPGSTYAELALLWAVSKETARKWCTDLGAEVVLTRSGPKQTVKVHRQTAKYRQVSTFGGDWAVDSTVTANRQSASIEEAVGLAVGGDAPDDYPDSATEVD